MFKPTHLKPTKQKSFNRNVFGFDIETEGKTITDKRGRTYKTNDFFMCSLKGHNYVKFFYSKQDFINELKLKRFKNSIIVATNLAFDFWGTFKGMKELKHFKILMPSSQLISVKTYWNRKTKSFQNYAGKRTESRTFIDTSNYCFLSVEKMGKILKMEKLDHPDFLGYKPKNDKEKLILEKYNERDSEISRKFFLFLMKSFQHLGGSFKETIAGTSMSIFRNVYLDKEYKLASVNQIKFQFSSFRGGRTESFKRGYFRGKFYLYDFNSLYPSVMHDEEFPDPNSLQVLQRGDISNITDYEGVSEVIINMPYRKIPLLSVKSDKLRFGNGSIKGVYTHIELKEALSIGGVIEYVGKQHIYTLCCRPFKSFIANLYVLRREYQKEDNPMELVVKLVMNANYGKWTQKFWDMKNMITTQDITPKDIYKYDKVEVREEFLFTTEKENHPSSFCFPIWGSYITAYARIKLFRAMKNINPYYCDTDSIITKEIIPTSTKLGDLKLERTITDLIIVRPKFYGYVEENKNIKLKLKGARIDQKDLENFKNIIRTKQISYKKFIKLKESLIQKVPVNAVMEVKKVFNLEDNKRLWPRPFSIDDEQDSEPFSFRSIP